MPKNHELIHVWIEDGLLRASVNTATCEMQVGDDEHQEKLFECVGVALIMLESLRMALNEFGVQSEKSPARAPKSKLNFN